MANGGHVCLVSMHARVRENMYCVFLNLFLKFFAVSHSDKTIISVLFYRRRQRKKDARGEREFVKHKMKQANENMAKS